MSVKSALDSTCDNVLTRAAAGALVAGVMPGVCSSCWKGIFRNDRRRCTRRKEIADLLDGPFAFEVVRSATNERDPPAGGFGLLDDCSVRLDRSTVRRNWIRNGFRCGWNDNDNFTVTFCFRYRNRCDGIGVEVRR